MCHRLDEVIEEPSDRLIGSFDLRARSWLGSESRLTVLCRRSADGCLRRLSIVGFIVDMVGKLGAYSCCCESKVKRAGKQSKNNHVIVSCHGRLSAMRNRRRLDTLPLSSCAAELSLKPHSSMHLGGQDIALPALSSFRC